MDIKEKWMEINLEQQKLISSPLRVKIIYLLHEHAMTAKQVADELGKTAGSIHYHIQQLYNGGILEIKETRENKGIIEKYYQAKATHFRLKDPLAPKHEIKTRKRGTSLSLSEIELKEFEAEWDQLVLKYLKKSVHDHIERASYQVSCQFEVLDEEEEN